MCLVQRDHLNDNKHLLLVFPSVALKALYKAGQYQYPHSTDGETEREWKWLT